MSGDPRARLTTALVEPFTDEAVAQSRRPPHAQRQSRAGYSSTALCLCYTTREMFSPFAHGPVGPAFEYGWCICAALGTWWLYAGFFGRARGPLVGGLGLVAEAAITGWLLWNRMYPFNMPLVAFLLHTAYLVVLWSAIAQILSSMIGPSPGDARTLVDENIEENEFDWDRV